MSPAPRIDALLRAARAEQPPPGSEQRLLGALGLEVAALPATGVGGKIVRGWRGLGATLGLVAVVALWAAGQGRGQGARVVEDDGTSMPLVLSGTPPAVLAAVTLDALAVPERALPVVAPARPPRHAVAAPPADPDDELAVLLDARVALKHHDAGAALAALERHARSFPRGAFAEEAAALRVEALVAAGRLEEGRRAADAFQVTYPRSPYGPRVQALGRGSP